MHPPSAPLSKRLSLPSVPALTILLSGEKSPRTGPSYRTNSRVLLKFVDRRRASPATALSSRMADALGRSSKNVQTFNSR